MPIAIAAAFAAFPIHAMMPRELAPVVAMEPPLMAMSIPPAPV